MNGQSVTYIIIELQTYENGTVGNIITQKNNYDEAQSVYHSTLAAAAVSNLPCHSAAILNNRGHVLENKYFVHEKETEQNI